MHCFLTEAPPSDAKRVCRNLFRMQHNRAAASTVRPSSMFDTVPKATGVHPVPANHPQTLGSPRTPRKHVTPRKTSTPRGGIRTSVSAVKNSPHFAKTNLSPTSRGARKTLYGENKTPLKATSTGWRCKTPDARGRLKLTLKSVTVKSETSPKTSDNSRFGKNVSPKTPHRAPTHTPHRKQSVSMATLQLSMPGREQIQQSRSMSVGNMVLKTPCKKTPGKSPKIKTPKKQVTLTHLPDRGQSPGDSSLFMTPTKIANTPCKRGTPPTNFTPRRSRRVSEALYSPQKCGVSTLPGPCGINSPLRTPKSLLSQTTGGATRMSLLDPCQSASCDAWALNTPTKVDHSAAVAKCHLRRTPRRRTMSTVGAESVGSQPTTPHKRRHSQTVALTPKGV